MRRLLLAIGICVLLVALVVGFGIRFNDTPTYPDASELREQYPEHVGERILLWTEVVGVADDRVLLDADGLVLRTALPPPSARAARRRVCSK
ncbi:MAG: hypothetical protein ABEK02_06455 [Haloquadratum sp.]